MFLEPRATPNRHSRTRSYTMYSNKRAKMSTVIAALYRAAFKG